MCGVCVCVRVCVRVRLVWRACACVSERGERGGKNSLRNVTCCVCVDWLRDVFPRAVCVCGVRGGGKGGPGHSFPSQRDLLCVRRLVA